MQPPPPPQSQPQSFPPQYPQPYYAPSPPPPRAWSTQETVVVAIVIVAAVIVAAVAVPVIQKAMTTPNVFVTEGTYSEEYCWSVPPWIVVVFTITLTNSGDADSIATVTFYQNQSTTLGSEAYIALQHSSVEKTAQFPIASCDVHSYQYRVTAVSKI